MNKICSIELKVKVPVKLMLVIMNIFSANEQKKCSIELKSKILPFAHKILICTNEHILVQMNKNMFNRTKI